MSEISDAAKTLSALGAAKGGRAAAASMTPEERAERAVKAAEARWAKTRIPTATHGSPDHPLKIGDTEIQAYVLDDGTRVLTQADFQVAMGKHRKANVRREGGEEQLPAILQGKSINPFIEKDLIEKSRPIKFRTPHGVVASGYRAEILPMVCETYLKARDAGALPKNLAHVAKKAEALIRGLAHVGIIALVDEATGYQYDRPRKQLEEILEKFIAKELVKWIKTFPDEFYEELFRLRGWKYSERPTKRPVLVGKLTLNLVYQRIAPGVLKELKKLTPRTPRGRHKHKLFQRLTEDVGHPKLREHLASVIALMKSSDDWADFYRRLERALPKYKDMPLFDRFEKAEGPLSEVEQADEPNGSLEIEGTVNEPQKE